MSSARRSFTSNGNPLPRVSNNGNGRSRKAWLCFVSCHYEDSSDSEAEIIDSASSLLTDQSDSENVRPDSLLPWSPPPPPPPHLPLPPNFARSPENGNEYSPSRTESRTRVIEEMDGNENEWPPENGNEYSPSPTEGRARVIEEMDGNENEWPVRGPPPAPDTVINSIPVLKISEAYMKDKFDCSVCQEEFKVGKEAKQLPCSHIYHPNCIVSWLSRHNSCPVCRRKLPESQIALSSDVDDSGYESTREELDEYQIHSPLRPSPSTSAVSAWTYFFS